VRQKPRPKPAPPTTKPSKKRSNSFSKGSSAPDSPARLAPSRASTEKPPTVEFVPEAELPPLSYYSDFSRFEQFCFDCLVIVDKNGQRTPFSLNSTQKKVLSEIRRLRALGIPPRLIVLKARQVGISTLAEALLFWACLTQGNRSALVVAHTLKSSKMLFRMSRNFHRWVPEPMRQAKRIDNIHEIEFDSGSRMQIEVQGDPRGYTAQDCHLSEYASYENPEDTLVAIMQTVPMIVESLVIIESTAKGIGNKFHRLWQRASGMALDDEIPDDEKGWTPIFIPWFQHEEYRIPIEAGTYFKLTTEEHRFMWEHREHKVGIDQIKWRRWCISTNLDGDEDMFAQEYPANAQEAFALSGRPAFDTKSVIHYTKEIAESVRKKEMPSKLEIESDPPGVGKIEIVEHERGRLRIFRQPQERCTYVLGADPSEGDPGSDHSPMAVFNQMTMDYDATWYGKAPPDLLACHAMDLGRLYHEALIIGESNSMGILFNDTLVQMGYPNIYYRKVSEESVAGEITMKPGYFTSARTREYLFNTLRKYVRMRMGKIPCPHFVEQMQSLVYLKEKAQAQAGSEKDMLIAGALCLMAHRGSMANELEALPEQVVRAVATEVLLLRERNPEEAAASAGRIGLTQEDILRQMDFLDARDAKARRFGVSR